MTQAVIVFQDDVTGKKDAYVSDVTQISPSDGFTEKWLQEFSTNIYTKKRILEKFDLLSITVIDAFYDIA